LDIKRSLLTKVANVLGPNAILASNTSGLSIAAMSEVLPEDVQKRFIVMHFFNPVRYMHLLEIVPGPATSPQTVDRITEIGRYLGKGVVYGKDTANFIGNRVGTYSMMKAFSLMDEMELTIEQVDKIVGVPMGRPKSAAFQTADIVGLDTFAHVAKNCYDSLTSDPEREVFKLPQWVEDLVKAGQLGRKTGAGFYKKVGKEIQVWDRKTGDYRPQEKVRFDSIGSTKGKEDAAERIKLMVNGSDVASKFAWKALAHTLCYAAARIPEIADDIVQIDRAMRWGYNWDLGPFQAWDAIGVPESVERMKAEGIAVPASVEAMLASGRTSFYEGPRAERTYFDISNTGAKPVPTDPKIIDLPTLKEKAGSVVKSNLGASLIDLGDGVLNLEVHTKMNTIDDDVTNMLKEAVDEAEKNFEALVIGNQGAHFGVGANVMTVFMAAQQKMWDQLDGAIKLLQDNLQGLRYAKIPVVAAPFQYTFGGCAEIAMAADACQASAETYMGLVEVGVGLVPAGGGCLRLVERFTGPVQDINDVDLLPFIGTASLQIATAKVAAGAEEAKRLRYLMPTDGISLHRDYLLHEAKQRALGMAKAGYRSPTPRIIKAAGIDAYKTISVNVWSMTEGGFASEHDAKIAKHVARILCGGDVAAGTELTEQHYLDLEREAFLSLCGEQKTQDRIQHMLMNNKPLRN
ncbi:MAG: 3-hydroxyacyl-CoA dehydrogenase/enoyl-CoA hydratase family protein, partial [Myxococcota bacterium]